MNHPSARPLLVGLASMVLLGFLSIEGTAQQLLPNTLLLEEGISVRYPDGWSVGQPAMHSWVILNVPAGQQQTVEPTVQVAIGYLVRTDAEDALSQLTEYENESTTPPTSLTIGGWPAFQRVQLVDRSQPGDSPLFPDPQVVQITTAVAASNLLVRLEASLPSNANQALQALVLAIGQSLMFSSVGAPTGPRTLQKLPSSLNRSNVLKPDAASLPEHTTTLAAGVLPRFIPAVSPPIFPPVQLANGTNGELEVAISNDGSNIVVVKQGGAITSNDGGKTFLFSSGLNISDGDSSIAFGQSGNFYHAGLSCFGSSCQPPCPGASSTGMPASTNNCVVVAPSTNKGQSFGALVNAAVCPNSGGSACALDQEHIAADRANAGTGGADRVYAAVRNCQGNCGTNGAFVTCSPDSDATWAPLLALEKGSDFPRVAVGGDGAFYVVYELGANIRIDKFNACTTSAAQMTRAAGFPKTVSGFSSFAGCGAANGFGGLDRCNSGNTLSGPTVTVDDTNANHVYVAWANNTAANNENILVADSTDGGMNWRTPVTVSTNATARRYHPWACATGGSSFVTWYDRRAATAANNDLTDYFAASAGLSGGTLVANNDEFKISTSSDAQCNLWPGVPRSTFDSENCSVQPQNAGNCSITTATRCDFSGGDGTQCPMGETCQTGGGAPKYGDYNGNACILGRLCTVFASGAGLGSIRDFFQCFVVSSTPTTLTYTGATTGDYHDTVTLSGVLTLSGTSAGIAGQTITFSVGTQNCSGVTNASGAASCSLTLNQVPGPYTVTASFVGSGNFQASSASKPFTITREETTTTYTGPTVIANGVLTTFSAVLLEDGDVTKPIAGRTITITLGTGGSAQTCSGTTDATGTATCPIVVNQPLGGGTVAATFAGDAFYLPSSGSATTILFAFLTRGAFVLGDKTATGTVEFWGNDWALANALTGGAAPHAFKGFAANTSEPPACSTAWTTRPGNSSAPPGPPLPSFMGVIVSSVVSKSGPTISGNVSKIVVVKTNPGYNANPGHRGTGTVVATFCK